MKKENIIIGCCGFPVALEKYVKIFGAVETQQTFYKLINEDTVKKWREKADAINPNFEFTIKAHQFITHAPGHTYLRAGIEIAEKDKHKYGYFRPTKEVFNAWGHTVKIAKELKVKTILLQSPPSFFENDENLRNIKNFFEKVGKTEFLLFWEPRGKWNDKTLKKIFKTYKIYHCVDPLKRKPLTNNYFYFRLHGGERYRHNYTQEELEEIFSMVSKLGGEKAYVFFNNLNMLRDAQKFLKLVSKNIV